MVFQRLPIMLPRWLVWKAPRRLPIHHSVLNKVTGPINYGRYLDPCTNNETYFCRGNEDHDCDTGVGTFPIHQGSRGCFSNVAGTSSVTTTPATASSTGTPSRIPEQQTTASPTSSAIPATDKNYDTVIGAGVGVPLGVIAIAIIAYLLHRNRRASKLIQGMQHSAGEVRGPGNRIDEPEWSGRQEAQASTHRPAGGCI